MISYGLALLFLIALLVSSGVLKFKTKKSAEIYDLIIAHRGLHISAPENTMAAYEEAIKRGFAIELDIRILKDGTIVCFYDRYTKRLLGFPGKINFFSCSDIEGFRVERTDEKVPTFKEVLSMVDSKVPLIIEVRGAFTKKFSESLNSLLENYDGKVYFLSKSVLTYYKLKKYYGDLVFFALNPFRQKFQFVKGKHYRKVNVPGVDNLIFSVETTDTAKTVISKMWKISNRYETRTRKDHWLFNTPIAHRGICNSAIPENSVESFEECVRKGVGIEADFVYYKGEIRCYHSDRASNRLGQPQSCADKIPIEDSISLEKFLEIVDGKVPVIFDIKDAHIINRRLEKLLMNDLNGYEGDYVVQCFNPRVVDWFRDNYPAIHRGQVGHSLRGLKNKVPNPILILLNFLLFYIGKPDYIMYDLDPKVHILPTFNNIVGLPVLGYAPTSTKELYDYKDFFANFVYEDLENKENWGNYFKERFNKDI